MTAERYSRQREVVYQTVLSTDCHPDADWVYERVRAVIPDISLGTVYRNLRRLVETGLMVTVETTDNRVHYDADVSDHAHFVCGTCKAISDLFYVDPLTDRLKNEGYVIHTGKRVFYGVCPACHDAKTQ